MVSFFFESIAFRVGDGEEESAEDDDDAGLSMASPEGSEGKERTGELGPRFRPAAACAVEKVRLRRPPGEGRARRARRGDDERPNDDKEDEENDARPNEHEDEDEDEGGSLKRGDDRQWFARGLTQRNLASIIGRRCVRVYRGWFGWSEGSLLVPPPQRSGSRMCSGEAAKREEKKIFKHFFGTNVGLFRI